MRKVAKVALYSVCLAVLLWFFLSWVDIVADNCEPNPHHSPYNVFVLMTQQEEKAEEPAEIEGTCGSPLTDRTRLATAIITNIDGNILTLVTLGMARSGQSRLDMAKTSQWMITCAYSSITWELTQSMMTRLSNSGKKFGEIQGRFLCPKFL